MPQRIKHQQTFNLLADILETLKFRGTIFFSSALSAPWGISLEKLGYPRFHITLRGECYVGTHQDAFLRAKEMDIFLLPNGDAHWIADNPSNKKTPSERAVNACELDSPLFQQGPTTHKLICGMVQFDEGLSHPIMDALPSVIHVEGIRHDSAIWRLVELIDAEIREAGSINSPVADRLTEVLFLKLLQFHVDEHQSTFGFLRAIRDKRIHQALSYLHENPARDWTLEELGKEVGMSKATLVRHFQDAVGVAPMTYLNHWRRLKAYHALRYTNDSMDKIAVSLGFTSGRTLSRSLVRELGLSPAEIRSLSSHSNINE
ncbi:AraC family transcriptional regulator [Enterovibrio nigricans]|uniref:Transcriptional regulator, AraC family n=1 Tax=Enterovibrio nigricans DSM 22720 TaxID=1121868 RepID=A0A1T4UY72_9GAMM|nr:AraC family transcriptional regulator [Enterovibrio nigricans]PKF50781.1 AraC family transcriptional regulator [Enterovibrio nigricans]SKA57683.1 transcriptional regulator, AraC family [Enterovibrio nigricans DSM 22720]